MRNQTLSAFPYYGGKAALAPVICDMLDYTNTEIFIEPFGGGARVLLNKPRHPVEIYNDASAGLCAFMRCMSDPQKAQEVIYRLYDTDYTPETFYAAVKLRNEEEDDYFSELKRQFKQYLSLLGKKYTATDMVENFQLLRQSINKCTVQMDWSPLQRLKLRGTLTETEVAQLTQFQKETENFLTLLRPIYADVLREQSDELAPEAVYTYIQRLSAQVKKLSAEVEPEKLARKAALEKRIQTIQHGKPNRIDAKRIEEQFRQQLYQTAYSHTLNNHESSFSDDISLAVATWIVYTMSRDGMGTAFSPQKFKTNEQYHAQISRLYDVAERMRGVQVSQSGALLYLMECSYLNDPKACFYLDPSYLDPENEQKNLGSVYKLSSDYANHELLLKTICNAKAKIVISNYDVPLYNAYLQAPQWKKYEIDTKTSVGGKADNYRTEVIWKNFD